MIEFVRMIGEVEMTNKTNAKRDAIVRFLQSAPDKDKMWVIALFTGKRPKRPVKTTLMKEWARELADIPEWLFLESHTAVGDLGETLSLILPKPIKNIQKPLYVWMDELIALRDASDQTKKSYVLDAWSGLHHQQRLIFNKLIGGSFRVGVSKKMLVNALAKYSDQDPNMLMHSLAGNWQVDQLQFEEFINGTHIDHDRSKPYPFALAHALSQDLTELGEEQEWQAEYKWDGIRGQIINREGEVFIWSRGEELVTAQFPELVTAFQLLERDCVIDGEILPVKDGVVLSFKELQKRLNRKVVSKKLLGEVPISFYMYDCLEVDGQDIRELPLRERRQQLESIGANLENSRLQLPPVVAFKDWAELESLRAKARSVQSEGLMLKANISPYFVGRKKGYWYKWKVDPLTIDAVMIYAQRGSGRRSGHYTDYTFAVRTDDGLVTIAKAYSGLAKDEIEEVSRFVRQNSIEKFGPVRTVKAELVFEIAFEGIALSKRHKSGVALRFPRIARWRRDKTVEEIDHIDQVLELLGGG